MKKKWKFKLDLSNRADEIRLAISELDGVALVDDIAIAMTTSDAFALRMRLDSDIVSIK